MHRPLLWQHYFRTWQFKIDIIAIIPLDFLQVYYFIFLNFLMYFSFVYSSLNLIIFKNKNRFHWEGCIHHCVY